MQKVLLLLLFVYSNTPGLQTKEIWVAKTMITNWGLFINRQKTVF